MKGSINAVSAAVLCSLLASCADPVPPTETLRPVKTVELKYNGEHDSHRYFAVVSPRNEVDQAFRVGGKVLERRVNVGQKVKKGDVLASLDDSDYKLAAEAAAQRLTAAQARAQQAESDWQRLQALKRDGSVSASQEEQARSNLSTAKATAEAEVRQLVLARNQVKYAVLTAPLSGVVTSLNMESGQVVAAGQPVIAIANEAEPEIVVNVPENHLETFKNSRFQASLASAPDELFDVTLRELSAQAAAQTRTFRARLKPEAGRKLSLGASATLITKSKGNDIPVAVIPASALTQHQGHPAVWSVRKVSGNEGAVELVNVSIHSYRNEDVLVYGPAAGTLVVTAGVQKMTAGLPVSLPVTGKQEVGSMKSFNLTEWALNNRSVVLFMILVITIAGVFGFSKIGQLEDPNFSVPSMTGMVVWPGATAQQIQDQVLNRMEKKFEQLDHFEKVVTFARQGFGGMTITVQGGATQAEQQEAWYQARKKFSDLQLEMPDGVIGPVFNDEYGDVYSLMYAVKGDGIGMGELADRAEEIKRSLLKVPMVKKVDLLGKQAERIYIEFSHERLAALGIQPMHIVQSLKSQNAIVPAGSIDTQGDRLFVRVTGQFEKIEDIRNLPVAVGDKVIRLGDFTTVSRGYEDPATYTVRHNGEQVLMLGLVMTSNGNVVELGKAVATAVADIQAELPYGVELELTADQPTTVKEAVWDFERALAEALIIVVLVSLVSLGWRTGMVVALSVPLVLCMVAIVMLAMGWNLERISLGSLIIALGLLVDDAIIALEMMVVKMEAGWDKAKAAAYSYTATAKPRLSGALVTVAAFMPVGLSQSSTGEYAGGIFWIVGAALVLSWFCSGVFTPYMAVKMLPDQITHHEGHSNPYDTPGFRKLRGWIERTIAKRWWVIGATAIALVLAVMGMKHVPQQFFPNSTRAELIVELRVKEGASIAATTEQVKHMEQILKKDEDVRFFTAYTGAGAPRFYLSLNPELPNPGFAQFVVMTQDLEARERVRSRLMAMADETFPQTWVRVTRLELGPPVGFPIQFRIVGPDTQMVRTIARQVEQVVAAHPETRDTQLDWNEPVRSLRVDLDQDKARSLGLSPADVAVVSQSLLNGAPVSQFREGEDLIDIMARAVPGERLEVGTLNNINLYTAAGAVVPLSQIAEVRYELEEPVLWRRNRDMAITVRADVKDGAQGVSVTQQIQPLLKDIQAGLPSGYRIDVGGAVEESEKANEALAAVAPLMLITILTILMLQLKSFSLMTMVFLTAPLGLIGVVAALLLFKAPLGFVAILGVIALAGMIMRNSIILIDQIQIEMASGRDPWSAVVDAAVQRARPVVLAAAAAVLAMIPLTSSVFWGPMAIAIMGGLTVATILTIFFVPALYAAWFRIVPVSEAQQGTEKQLPNALL